MTNDGVDKPLETLELAVEGLPGLPIQVAALDRRVESLERQVFQFRKEVRDEFLAVRRELKDESEQTRTEMRALHEEVLTRIKLLGERDR